MSIAFAEFETAPERERFTPRNAVTQCTLLHCLILAEDAKRREFLAEAARMAGWVVTAPRDASAASNVAARYRQALVIIDLDCSAPGSASSLRTLAEQIGADKQRLLLVCGTDGNPLEEIWARQLGVWLYLAGVDPMCDVTTLCREAKQVAEKLAPPIAPSYARTA